VFTGRIGDDPLYRATGAINFSVLGVGAFFVLSGFLVTRSWLERPQLPAFAAARAAHLFRAIRRRGAVDRSGRRLECRALARVSRVARDDRLRVEQRAGVGDSLRASRGLPDQSVTPRRERLAVDAARGTAALHRGGDRRLRRHAGRRGALRRRARRAAGVVCLEARMAAAATNSGSVRDLAWLFGLGALAYVARAKLPLSLAAFAAGVALYAANPGGFGRGMAFTLTLAYGVLVLAYHPRIQWRRYNRVGDYSYGLYVYAFPIQQTIIGRWPGLSTGELFAWSFAATLAMAAISWHGLEQPALALKSWFRKPPPTGA
jgi:peptidoglycan/LPS O-acetylase OafA/YrhL